MDNILQETSMFITKASLTNGEMRWSATNSDTSKDLYGERMSVKLYKSMIGKINRGELVPEKFASLVTSDWWKGGMPYVSLAHYPDGNGKAVPGMPEKIYIDGKALKAKGKMFDTPLGRAVWKSLEEDENNQIDDRIRISVGFLDLAHKHGEDGEIFERKALTDICPLCKSGTGEKIYLDGYLVHLALTRVPVNPRTLMTVEKSMAKKTRKDDALSIVKDEALVEEVEKAALETKSDVLVEMSETKPVVEESQSEPVVEPVQEAPVVEEACTDKPEDRQGENMKDGETTPKKEKSFDGEVEQVQAWKPYGGATSLKEAQQFTEAQQESWRVSDLYYTFSDVARNIMDAEEIEDKAGALAKLLDEFKKSLVAKALYDELVQIKSGVIKDRYVSQLPVKELAEVVKSLLPQPSPAEVAVPEEVKVEKSALDISVENLYNSVNQAMQTKNVTIDERLASINPALQELGQAITEQVKQSVGVETKTEANDGGMVLEALTSLTNTVKDLATEVATLKAQKSQVPEQPRIPAPRAVTPIIQASMTTEKPVNPNSVTNIVRRSVSSQLELK